MRPRWYLTLLIGGVLCGCDPMSGHPTDGGLDGFVADAGGDAWVEPLRLNHMQVRGTVNSYHDGIPEGPAEIHYAHPPLFAQAGEHAVRQFDFDVYGAGGDGEPLRVFDGRIWFDELVVCEDRHLVSCLDELVAYSDARPEHLPLVLLVGSTVLWPEAPAPFFWHVDELEEQVVGRFGRERILTPAAVRRGHPDLAAALADEGWPRVDDVRGKVLVVLNDRGEGRTRYIERGGMSADERFMFIVGDPAAEAPDEVIYTFEGADVDALAEIERLVRAGRLVHATTDDPDMVPLLRAAGAHMIATRYLEDVLGPPDDEIARCNPVKAPPECEAWRFEARDERNAPE